MGPCLETSQGDSHIDSTTRACPRGAVFPGGSAGMGDTAPPRHARMVASSFFRFRLVSKHGPTGTSPARGLHPSCTHPHKVNGIEASPNAAHLTECVAMKSGKRHRRACPGGAMIDS